MDNFTIRVVIADDHPVMIIGVEQELSTVGAVTIVGSARNSTELIAILDKTPCDVLVSDYAMPGGAYGDGIALFSYIQRHYPMTKLVVLTMLDNPAVLSTLLAQKISCVVSKSDAVSHLVPAIYAAHTGKTYYSPTVINIAEAMELAPHARAAPKALTQREAEVVRLYASGLTVNAIAEQLHRSKKTISTQKTKAMEKLGIRQDVDLLRYAIENGFITSSQMPSTP
ncbi:two component transcriptional regulator, LuxR family [Collimonas sp. OK242]|jgi:two-component system capsular synthesis response regulator RcsB|uniref:response regulator n=1 Tax=Collimonas sp. OK242 TaxID=1798195 RepID=UPI00089B3216|nr:response regulator [Collimonas sp. OK242]SDX28097.1 two component transcriptional regulator, LuxR family [Collimonas sp. OK242]